jgi:hypothetical protein
MIGLNLLVRAGRYVLAGPVSDSGLLPGALYRHLALAALEEDDFPGALRHLKWADDAVLVQLTVLRLRLLAESHRRRRRALEALLASDLPPVRREACRTLLGEEDLALELLGDYEAQARALNGRAGTVASDP